MGKILFFLNF